MAGAQTRSAALVWQTSIRVDRGSRRKLAVDRAMAVLVGTQVEAEPISEPAIAEIAPTPYPR